MNSVDGDYAIGNFCEHFGRVKDDENLSLYTFSVSSDHSHCESENDRPLTATFQAHRGILIDLIEKDLGRVGVSL